MTRRKRRRPARILFAVLLLCLAAAVSLVGARVFATPEILLATTSAEAAGECQAKITKMLIDETLSFKFKTTEDIHFSEMELNSWLNDNLSQAQRGQVVSAQISFHRNGTTFTGLLRPFDRRPFEKSRSNSLLERIITRTVSFRVETKPTIRENQIHFEPRKITLGHLPIPPQLVPRFLEALHLNPFTGQIRTVKELRLADRSLYVTVYID
jgi:hypothetical protein